MNTELYALDTARAKTAIERGEIGIEMMKAQERGESVYIVHDDGSLRTYALSLPAIAGNCRFVTKRRPALVIPALELFELPAKMLLIGDEYFIPMPSHDDGYVSMVFGGYEHETVLLGAGLCFRTSEPAAAVGLHIRNELAKAVRS